jgi:hypothetical protein
MHLLLEGGRRADSWLSRAGFQMFKNSLCNHRLKPVRIEIGALAGRT